MFEAESKLGHVHLNNHEARVIYKARTDYDSNGVLLAHMHIIKVMLG